jgi:hypothetical protein
MYLSKKKIISDRIPATTWSQGSTSDVVVDIVDIGRIVDRHS